MKGSHAGFVIFILLAVLTFAMGLWPVAAGLTLLSFIILVVGGYMENR